MPKLPETLALPDGRTLHLREIDPGLMLDLIEAAGSAASSGAWMRYALMVCSVDEIDGKPVMMPITKQAVRALATRIGNVGMEAIAAVTYPDLVEKPAGDEDKPDQPGPDDAAKN